MFDGDARLAGNGSRFVLLDLEHVRVCHYAGPARDVASLYRVRNLHRLASYDSVLQHRHNIRLERSHLLAPDFLCAVIDDYSLALLVRVFGKLGR